MQTCTKVFMHAQGNLLSLVPEDLKKLITQPIRFYVDQLEIHGVSGERLLLLSMQVMQYLEATIYAETKRGNYSPL